MKYFIFFFFAFEASASQIRVVFDIPTLEHISHDAIASFNQGVGLLNSATLNSLSSAFVAEIEFIEVKVTSSVTFEAQWKFIYGENSFLPDNAVYILNGPQGIRQINFLLDRVIEKEPDEYSSMAALTHFLYLVYVIAPEEYLTKSTQLTFDFERSLDIRTARLRKLNQVLFRVLNKSNPNLFSEKQKQWLRYQMQGLAEKLKNPCELELSSNLILKLNG